MASAWARRAQGCCIRVAGRRLGCGHGGHGTHVCVTAERLLLLVTLHPIRGGSSWCHIPIRGGSCWYHIPIREWSLGELLHAAGHTVLHQD